MPLVYIVIVNWNGFEDTIECIHSLLKIMYGNYVILIVDNGSDKHEDEMIKEKFPSLLTLRSNKNLGFAGGNNLGIKYALDKGADYILLLNNDTTVEPEFLNILINDAKSDNQMGIAVPKINFYSDKKKIWYAGGYISKLRGSAYTLAKNKPDVGYDQNKYVSFATGCCLLIDSKVIKKIGLMDEKYFLYLEDADYSVRTIKNGFKILFSAKSKIYHKINKSAAKEHNLTPLYYNTRNRLIFTKKFFPKYFYAVFIYLLLTFTIKALYAVILGDLNRANIIYMSFKDFFNDKTGKVHLSF